MDGSEIRRKREELELTQSELASLVGVSLRTIQNYEKGGVIPASKSEILHKVLNSGDIKITGSNNISNTGIIGESVNESQSKKAIPLYLKGVDREINNVFELSAKEFTDSLYFTIEKQREEIEQLKKDKENLQKLISLLQKNE